MIAGKITAGLFLTILFACSSGEQSQDTPSPGVLSPSESAESDTSRLLTDSVLMRDSNTADIEPMKKIN